MASGTATLALQDAESVVPVILLAITNRGFSLSITVIVKEHVANRFVSSRALYSMTVVPTGKF